MHMGALKYWSWGLSTLTTLRIITEKKSNDNETDGHDAFGKGPHTSEYMELNKGNYDEDSKQLSLLLCSEKAAYVYSLTHIAQVTHASRLFLNTCNSGNKCLRCVGTYDMWNSFNW